MKKLGDVITALGVVALLFVFLIYKLIGPVDLIGYLIVLIAVILLVGLFIRNAGRNKDEKKRKEMLEKQELMQQQQLLQQQMLQQQLLQQQMPQPQAVCPGCNQNIPAGTKFCPNCGGRTSG